MNPYQCEMWAKVESSNLEAVGVNGQYLVCKFKKGGAYRYDGAAGLFEKMIKAESVGRFFHQYIRQGKTERLCSKGCFEPVREAPFMCQKCKENSFSDLSG